MPSPRPLVTLCAALLLFATGCLALPGNGKAVTQTRQVGAFKELLIKGGVQVTFTQGARAVAITTDDNLLSEVVTEVVGDALVIRPREPFFAPTRLEATVSNERLERVEVEGGAGFTGSATAVPELVLEASGGSRITLTGHASASLIVEASGGSRATVDGAATKLRLLASGGSEVTGNAVVDQVTVAASGGSTARVRVGQSLTGAASGGSTVFVAGAPPTVDVLTSGGGRVVAQN